MLLVKIFLLCLDICSLWIASEQTIVLTVTISQPRGNKAKDKTKHTK